MGFALKRAVWFLRLGLRRSSYGAYRSHLVIIQMFAMFWVCTSGWNGQQSYVDARRLVCRHWRSIAQCSVMPPAYACRPRTHAAQASDVLPWTEPLSVWQQGRRCSGSHELQHAAPALSLHCTKHPQSVDDNYVRL